MSKSIREEQPFCHFNYRNCFHNLYFYRNITPKSGGTNTFCVPVRRVFVLFYFYEFLFILHYFNTFFLGQTCVLLSNHIIAFTGPYLWRPFGVKYSASLVGFNVSVFSQIFSSKICAMKTWLMKNKQFLLSLPIGQTR